LADVVGGDNIQDVQIALDFETASIVDNARPGEARLYWNGSSMIVRNQAGEETPLGGAAFGGPRLITVGATGAEHTTIAAGLAAASALSPPPSMVNPAMVLIFPGSYTESPLTIPSWVTLAGAGGERARIVAGTTTSPLITMSANSTVEKVVLAGANGVGGSAVNMTGAGRAHVSSVRIFDCTTGVIVNNASAQLLLIDVHCHRDSGQTLTTAFHVTAGEGIFQACVVNGESGVHVGTAAIIDGATAVGHFSGLHAEFLDVGILVDNGGEVDIHGSEVGHVDDAAFRVDGANSTLWVAGTVVHGFELTNTLWLDVISATADVHISGAGGDHNRMSLNAAANITANYLSDFTGDKAASALIGELQVGTEDFPSEAAFGGGDSHARGMSVLVEDNSLSSFTDRTAEAKSFEGSTFSGLGDANDAIYVGADYKFPGIRETTTVALVPGAGSTILEYWTGSAWSELLYMCVDAIAPYLSHARSMFQRVQSDQCRWDPPSDWATTAVNSITKFWVRLRNVSAITTPPTVEQVKIHTHRLEINGDGFLERFGTAIKTIPAQWHQVLEYSNNDGDFITPGNTDVVFTANFEGIYTENSYLATGGSPRSRGGVFTVPNGLDTSRPIKLRITYVSAGTSTVNVRWSMGVATFIVGTTVLGLGVSETVVNVDQAPPGTANVLDNVELEFTIPDANPGDMFTIQYNRDQTVDANPDEMIVVATSLEASFWQ
jgi:hypothetical protein